MNEECDLPNTCKSCKKPCTHTYCLDCQEEMDERAYYHGEHLAELADEAAIRRYRNTGDYS